jgi:hypothetical protein
MLFYCRLLLTGSIYYFFACGWLFSQIQPPPNLKWNKISTSQFKIIYPAGLDTVAFRLASTMELTAQKVPDVYKLKTKPINLYLNNQTFLSNGYTALAPRHMQYYIHAPQDVTELGSTDWLKLLAIHEYRHVVQFDYFKRNFSLVPASLFGDYGLAVISHMALPFWYFEGDAVAAETMLSNLGRGRLPSFEMKVKAIVTDENQKFTYNQAYLGSYKRYFPNYYYLGYYMYTHIARNYGIKTWPLIINRVTYLPILPYSFSRSLKKNTGFYLVKTYRNTINELKEQWAGDLSDLPAEIKPIPTEKNKVYTHYKYGQRLTSNDIVCVKYGMADAPELIKIDSNGKETKIREINNDFFISSNGQKIVWNTLKTDIRWGMRDFSDIMLIDLSDKRVKKITRKGKFLSPSISPSGTKIAAIRYEDTMSYSLVIIDANNNKLFQEYRFSSPLFVRNPSWTVDEKEVIFLITSESITRIMSYNLSNGQIKTILETSDENISKPIFWKNYILFTSSVRGKDEVHAIKPSTGQRYIALTGGFGFFNLSNTLNNDEIIIESYTSNGFRLYSWKPDSTRFTMQNSFNPHEYYISPVIRKGKYSNIFKNDNQQMSSYSIKKYYHLIDGPKLHSWAVYPYYQGPAVNVYINDPLSIIGIEAGLQYNQNEKNTNQSFKLTYSGLFPVISTGISAGWRTSYKEFDNDSSDFYQWFEYSGLVSVSLPLDLSIEAYTQKINVTASFNYTKINHLDNRFKDNFDIGNGTFNAVELGFFYIGYKHMSMRDLFPCAGLMFVTKYKTTIVQSDYRGSLFSVNFTSFFKGISRHHSLRLNAAYEYQNPSESQEQGYIFPSQMLYFRGYESIFYKKFSKLSIDYSMPLFYPDFGIGSLLYLKRIRTNLFTDIGLGNSIGNKKTFFSYGADFLFDINLFRLLIDIDLGCRLAITRENDVSVSFVFLQQFGY